MSIRTRRHSNSLSLSLPFFDEWKSDCVHERTTEEDGTCREDTPTHGPLTSLNVMKFNGRSTRNVLFAHMPLSGDTAFWRSSEYRISLYQSVVLS